MKFKSPFYKRIISAVLALTLVIGCGFGTAMAADPPAITVAQSVALVDWNARTYEINLTATASSVTQTTMSPSDILLVLDDSGSMAEKTYTKLTGTPDQSKTYYVSVGGDWHAVTYQAPLIFPKGWYYESWPFPTKVPAGTPFYVQGTKTKTEELKEAAGQFISSVKNASPDSRIGIIRFADDAEILTNKRDGTNNYKLLRCGNEGFDGQITAALGKLVSKGSTHADDGLKLANTTFKNDNAYEQPVNQNDNRKKIVVFFTDGEPNHGSGFDPKVATTAEAQATQLKAAPINATVFSIGVFSDSIDSRVEPYMRNVASEDAEGKDYYYRVTDTLPLNDIFKQIQTQIGGVSGATMTYTVDPRFVIQNAGGGSVSGQTITWSGQNVPYNNGQPSWNKTIQIVAKTEFIGGNSIPVMTSSSITFGSTNMSFGASPLVNVKPIFYLGNAETTIFLGQSVPTNIPLQPYTLNDSNQHVTGQGMYIVSTGTTGTFAYQWSGNGANAATQAFPSGLCPKSDTSYKLTATFSSSASWVAMKTTGGNPYAEPSGGNKANNTDYNANNYTVHVKSGSMMITKKITDKDGKAITDPGRSFVFLVTGQAESGDTEIKPFYVTITMGANGTASKTVTGLSKGTYTVKEVGSNWQYQNGTVQLNSPSGKIGYAKNGAGTDYTDKDLTASVTNELANNQWFSATDSVTNLVS